MDRYVDAYLQGPIMIVQAMKLRIGDMLSDGTVIASISRTDGHVYAMLEDGRKLVCPDHYLLGVTRAPKDESPEIAPGAPVADMLEWS